MSEYDDPADGSSMAEFVKKANTWGLKLSSYEGQEHADIGNTSNLGVNIGKHRAARMASEQYANFQSFFDNGGVPVSYTHLDVYKRQAVSQQNYHH